MIELQLVENEVKPFEQAMEAEMVAPIKHFEGELLKIRTNRAHTSLIEDVMITVYDGQPMPLKQIASLAAPDARMITVQPWDASTLNTIEKTLRESDLGISPQNDGLMIKVILPEMSSTRRDELVKILGKKVEECKMTIRNVRKDFNNLIRDAKKNKKISENFFNRLSDVLQKITDKFVAQADSMGAKKKTALTTI